MRVTFMGLGVMGAPMAGHLADGGHAVTVFNRSPEKATAWASRWKGEVAGSPEQAVEGAELIALCVGNDDDVRGLISRALPAMTRGAVIVDHTTTSAKVAREMSALCAERGVSFLDAPVSGGEAGAKAGTLSAMVGGDADALAKVEATVGAYAKAIKRIGESGSGQLAKMVNQICIAGVVQGLAEAVTFARTAGLDADLVYQAISKGAAQSWQMDNRWATMADGQVRLRLRGGLDAQGSRAGARRGAGERRPGRGDGPGRPVLRRGAGDGRASAGIPRAWRRGWATGRGP